MSQYLKNGNPWITEMMTYLTSLTSLRSAFCGLHLTTLGLNYTPMLLKDTSYFYLKDSDINYPIHWQTLITTVYTHIV